jgi:hypothetical protein
MPTIILSLRSQRSKPVPDRPDWIEVRGRLSGPMHRDSIEVRNGDIVLDAVPDQYRIRVEVNGFKPANGVFDVGKNPVAKTFPLEHRCTTLPTVGQMNAEQRRLLQTLDDTKTPGEVWAALSDNKAATFFQVTHALASVATPDGSTLAAAVDRVVRVGGSELTAPDAAGATHSVVGWRMHVLFVGGTATDILLAAAGFKRDPGDAHPTHKRFGFVRSFREKTGATKLQVVTNHEGTGADVDLDAGSFHRSSPHDVYRRFKQRFPGAASIFVVE